MTDLYGIIAHPVKHSLSPAMHNAAFKALGMDARFEAFEITPEKLGEFMKSHTDLRGLAVSIPHKETIGQHLDALDPIAQKIGAVNTVYWKEGKRRGTNTDAPGFLQALEEKVPTLKGKKAVVLGAGGAARAIVAALMGEGAHVTVVNRTFEKAKQLAEVFGAAATKAIQIPADILVNATSVGLDLATETDLVPPAFLKPGLVVFDLVYNPRGKTRLLTQAEAAGSTTIDGKTMLLYQGMLQFELWTGQKAPRKVMEKALISPPACNPHPQSRSLPS